MHTCTRNRYKTLIFEHRFSSWSLPQILIFSCIFIKSIIKLKASGPDLGSKLGDPVPSKQVIVSFKKSLN